MGAKYWLKLYHEILDDPKVMTLRPPLRWRFIETLLVAGELDEDGMLPEVRQYAWRVRSDYEQTESELAELADVGLLSRQAGLYIVTKFAERQAAVSDAERMRRYRKRQRLQDSDEGVTVGVTFRNTDTDKIRKDIDVDERPVTHSEYVPPESGDIVRMKTALTQYVKTRLTFKSEDDFRDAADAFVGWEATEEQLRDFQGWWNKNGYYDGKPALKSLVEEWPNYLASLNGSDDDFLVGIKRFYDDDGNPIDESTNP